LPASFFIPVCQAMADKNDSCIHRVILDMG
jgi:hypothetical protein